LLSRAAFSGPGDELPRPHDNCYWLVPGRLLAGQHPGAGGLGEMALSVAALLDAGIRQTLDLTEHRENLPGYGPAFNTAATALGLAVQRQAVPIADFSVPELATMQRILAILNGVLSDPAAPPLYLHCHGGIGRTGTVVGCLLVARGFTPDEALALIGRKWQVMAKRHRSPESPETEAQRDFIRAWPVGRLGETP